jgi:tetratricopeptide (TPR) repeat protein
LFPSEVELMARSTTTSNGRRRHPPAVSPGFATSAYRADAAGRDAPFGEHDSEWIVVATYLEHAAILPEPGRSALLDQTIELATCVTGEAAVARLRAGDWNGTAPGPYDAVVSLADDMHDAHALHLAAHMFDALLAASPELEALHTGRILDRRARIAHKLGQVEHAADHYTLILELARQAVLPELHARAWLGRAILAQVRGNYPAIGGFARRAARVADRDGLRSLSRHAHTSLMIAAGSGGRLDDALAHGWLAYDAARGEPAHEADVLLNLAQSLLNAGYTREARAGFAAVIATAVPARTMLPALGGFAIVSAILRQDSAVAWAAEEVERIKRSGATDFAVASALLECAIAFASLGQITIASERANAALRMARAHGFHEIIYKAESLDCTIQPVSPRRTPLGVRGTGVARDVARLEPDQLPRHVMLAGRAQ